MKANILIIIISLVFSEILKGQGHPDCPCRVWAICTSDKISSIFSTMTGSPACGSECYNPEDVPPGDDPFIQGTYPPCTYVVNWNLEFWCGFDRTNLSYKVEIQETDSYPGSKVQLTSTSWTNIYESGEWSSTDHYLNLYWDLPVLPHKTYRAVTYVHRRFFGWHKCISATWSMFECCQTIKKFSVNGQSWMPSICSGPIKLDFSESGNCPFGPSGDGEERISIQQCHPYLYLTSTIGPKNTKLLSPVEIQGYGGSNNFDLIKYNNSFNTFTFQPGKYYLISKGPKNLNTSSPSSLGIQQMPDKKIVIYILPTYTPPDPWAEREQIIYPH